MISREGREWERSAGMTKKFAALWAVFPKHNDDNLGNSVEKPAAGGFFLDSPFLKCSFLMDFEHFEMILRLGKTFRHQGRVGICRREWEWISWEGWEQETMGEVAAEGGRKKNNSFCW